MESRRAHGAATDIEQSWRNVGGCLTQATLEAAERIGDEDLTDTVYDIVRERNTLPDPKALMLLEAAEPGLSDEVINRTAELLAERHKRASSRNTLAKAFTEGMLSRRR